MLTGDVDLSAPPAFAAYGGTSSGAPPPYKLTRSVEITATPMAAGAAPSVAGGAALWTLDFAFEARRVEIGAGVTVAFRGVRIANML